MSTFAALLPAGHSRLSATSRDLEMALRANPIVTGSVPALGHSRRKWAAAVEYLQDAANVVDVATLMALSVSQRKVLCELLGAAPSADAQTAAAHIVCMYGSPLNQQPPPPPPLPPPSQWRDLMAAAHNVPLPASDAMTASAAEIVAKLACTPFVAAPAGLGLPQLQEVGYCTLWAHEYLTGQGAWDSLTATAQAELCAHLGISAAMAPEWAQKSFYCNLRFLEG